MWSLFC